jgi:sugar/nucleoside kinase (ribokinase family)
VLLVGSVSRDLRSEGGSTPGGVPHHAGLALCALGARVRVLTRIAQRDAALLEPLQAAGAELHWLPSAATTTCRCERGAAGDRTELLACSDPIRAQDVPGGWHTADAIQLGPLHRRDLAPGLARALRGRVGLDVQGLVRSGRGARTRLAAARGLGARLEGVQVLKSSADELPFVLAGAEGPERFRSRAGIAELLVTHGPRGATLFSAGGQRAIEPVPAQVRFPVGAGDVFLAAYLYARARGREPGPAARFASRASAAKIEAGALPAGFALEEEET